MTKKINVAFLLCLLGFNSLFAQATPNTNQPANDKLYVVLTVVLVIVCGLFLYLINLDKKISKLEKKK